MKKIVFLNLLCICGILFPLFAATLKNPLDAKVIHTEWFEIIYNEPQTETAMFLAEIADDVYLQANHDLGVEPRDHLSVVISGVTQNVNAYWTHSPYDRLCLYDAAPDIWDLGSYDESIRSVFYHELVHHVTFTMTDPESSKLRQFVDRYLYLSNTLNMSLGFAEGATVSKESNAQAGRLQNGYVLHTILQAKAESKALNWEEMSGVRDFQSIGNWGYYMGGAFARYIQDTYGDELYTRWWQKSSHFNIDATEGIFKKVYGKKLNDVWKEFYESIPEIELTDAFTQYLDGHNRNYGYYESMRVIDNNGTKGVAICDFTHRQVSFYPLFEDGTFGKPEKLQEVDSGTIGFTANDEGTLYALSGLASDTEDRYETQLYTMKGKKAGKAYDDMRIAAFMNTADGKPVLAGIKTSGYRSVLTAYEINSTVPLFEKTFPMDDELYGLAAGPDNTMVLLEKKYGVWQIALYDITGNEVFAAAFSQTIVPRFINRVTGTDNRFTLSVAGHTMDGGTDSVPGAVPRSAEIVINRTTEGYQALLAIDTENVSGGLYEPVVISENTIAAIRNLSDGMILVTGNTLPRATSVMEPVEPTEVIAAAHDVTFEITRYNPFGYLFKGSFFPMEMFPYESNISSVADGGMGLSFYSGDPAESFFYMIGAGWNPFSKQITGNLNVSGDAGKIHWSAFTQYINADGNNFVFNNLLFSTTGYLWNRNWTWYKAFNPAFLTSFAGRNTTLIGQFVSEVSYSAKKGHSLYECFGISAYANPGARYVLNWDSFDDSENTLLTDLNAGVKLQLPRLLPFNNPRYFTLNMPWSIGTSLYMASETPLSVNGNLEVILFSTEIQKRLIPDLYGNRITFKTGLETTDFLTMPQHFASMNAAKPLDVLSSSVDTISLEGYVIVTTPFGVLANSPIKFGGKCDFKPTAAEKERFQWSIVLESGDR